MHDTKPWYLSAGVWGAVAAAVASALSLVKVKLDVETVDRLGDWMLSAASLAASGVALYGRVRASRRIVAARTAADPAAGSAGDDGAHRGPNSHNRRLNRLIVVALLAPAAVCGAAGCGALGRSPSQAYVAADRATYEAVAPEYATYVNDDATLDDDQRARRVRTVETWRLRIESAERAAGGRPPAPAAPAAPAAPPPVPGGPSATPDDDAPGDRAPENSLEEQQPS